MPHETIQRVSSSFSNGIFRSLPVLSFKRHVLVTPVVCRSDSVSESDILDPELSYERIFVVSLQTSSLRPPFPLRGIKQLTDPRMSSEGEAVAQNQVLAKDINYDRSTTSTLSQPGLGMDNTTADDPKRERRWRFWMCIVTIVLCSFVMALDLVSVDCRKKFQCS